MNKCFGKNNRLAKDTSKVIETGKRIRVNNLVMYYLPLENPKLSVVISRKVGKSTLRNKLRRWTREIFRNEKTSLKNFGIVIIYKPDLDEYCYQNIKDSLNDIWSRAGIKEKER